MAMKRETAFSPKAFLSKVGEGRHIADYPKGHVLFQQGDPCDEVFFIQSGKVKIMVVSDSGKEAVVALLAEDEFLGESCLTGSSLRISTATTMTEARIVRIKRELLSKVLSEEPTFAELFILHLLSRNVRIEADLVDQLFNSSEKRLARALLLLANFGKSAKREALIAKISQETLAEIVGTTRSRVSHFMNKFRKLGFISYGADSKNDGGIHVHRSLLNAVLHEQPRTVREP